METKRPYPFILILLVIGAGGIIAQTVLLREFLILFSGNELSIGIIIGSWVIWEAAGAFLGGKGQSQEAAKDRLFAFSLILFAVVFPSTIYLARTFKIIIGLPQEIGVGILPIFYSSLLILLPAAFLHGFLFTLACSLYSRITNEGVSSTGKVYFYEMAGTILGGLLANYWLIPAYNSFTIAIGIGGLTALAGALAVRSIHGIKNHITLGCSLIVIASSALLLTMSGTETIHRESVRQQWQGKDVISYENSIYQNIVVTKNENQYTFFSDGIPIITTPVPDIGSVEELAHFSLLAHPLPESILILGGGAGGLIHEILKYPMVKRIDYVEIDPLLLRTIRLFSTPLTEAELNNPLVRLFYLDGRRFVKEVAAKYDVVLLGAPPPHTLQGNRLFTEEFFNTVRVRLNKGGIISFNLPGSLTYYSKELKELNLCILETLKKVFPHVFVVPGDLNLFVASKDDGIEQLSPALLFERLKSSGVTTNLITLPHLSYRFEQGRRDWFYQTMAGTHVAINRDFLPEGLFYSLAYENLRFSPALKPFFDYARHITTKSALIALLILFLIFLTIKRKQRGVDIFFAITATGFTAMVLQLILLFSFQIFYGYVFYEVALLITTFMGGMAVGSLSVTSRRVSPSGDLVLFKYAEGLLVAFALLLYLGYSAVHFVSLVNPAFVKAIHLCLLFVSGLLTGMEFPLANRIYLNRLDQGLGTDHAIGKGAGLIYSVDLLGGWIGGFLGGLLLLPILGLANGCLVLAALKGSSLLLLSIFPQQK